MALNEHTAAVIRSLVVLIAVVQVSVTSADRLFFKDEPTQTNVHAAIGENIVLECEAGGSLSPTIHFLYNGRRIQQVRDGRVGLHTHLWV